MRGRLAAASPERADLGYEVEVELVEILRARPGGTGPECE